MKKVISLIICMLFISACSKKVSSVDVVKNYLDNYVNLSSSVKSDLKKVINENDEFNDENKDMYKKLLEKQYKDLKYTILTEEYDDDISLITVNIEVYDLNASEKIASDYLSKNLKEFYNEDNVFDNHKYINYKLDLMYNDSPRINYSLIFSLKRKNNEWILEKPTNEDLEKIHGIYKNNS